MKSVDFDKVSVIMAVYNTNPDYLKEAVLSILNQTYQNFELLIVDDNSNKDLYYDDIFKDPRIKIFRNNANHGPAYCRNIALSHSSGNYIAIMDSDDIAYPIRFEEQIKFLQENKEVVACGSWYKHFGEKNNEVKINIDDNEYYRCCLLFGNSPTIINPTVMIKREVLEKNCIWYDESLIYGEDYNMWSQLSRIGIVTNIKKILLQYRVHDNQLTHHNEKEHKSLKYDSIVKTRQLESISTSFSNEEKTLFSTYYETKHINNRKYFKLLKKVIDENQKSCLYNQEKLIKRVTEQWESRIRHINNPFTLFGLLFRINNPKKNVFDIKLRQLKRKIKGPNDKQ